MNRLFRNMRKKHRLATLKEMKDSAKRVTRIELAKAQMREVQAILSITFDQYIQYELKKAIQTENFERANELHLLKNR